MESKRKHIQRHSGDIIQNGAILVTRINGQKWKIRCKCGNIFIGQPSNTLGRCRECSYKEVSAKKTIHYEAPHHNRPASRLYRIWLGMKARCNTTSSSTYNEYGGRNIEVCPEWNDYLNFKAWAFSNGYKDSLSIDRINVNGNYEPSNCRWADKITQGRNRRNNHLLTYKGETKTMAEWAEIYGIKYHTLKRRINHYGFSVEEALTSPVSPLSRKQKGVCYGN